MTHVLTRRGNLDTQRDTSNTHTLRKEYMRTERRWLPTSQGERPEKKLNPPTP